MSDVCTSSNDSCPEVFTYCNTAFIHLKATYCVFANKLLIYKTKTGDLGHYLVDLKKKIWTSASGINDRCDGITEESNVVEIYSLYVQVPGNNWKIM